MGSKTVKALLALTLATTTLVACGGADTGNGESDNGGDAPNQEQPEEDNGGEGD